MEASFELFDHTADMGVRVRAESLGGLVQPAIEGLYSVIGELAAGSPAGAFRFDQSGEDRAALLRNLLGELLVLFERDHRRLADIDELIFSDNRLHVDGATTVVDPERSVFLHEVKAVTYHELAIHEVPGGFEATYIVDI